MLLFTVKTKVVGLKALDVYPNRIELITKTRESKLGNITIRLTRQINETEQKALVDIFAKIATKQLLTIQNETFEREDIPDIHSLMEYVGSHSNIFNLDEVDLKKSHLGQISVENIKKLELTGYEKRVEVKQKRFTLELFIKRIKVQGYKCYEYFEYPASKYKTLPKLNYNY